MTVSENAKDIQLNVAVFNVTMQNVIILNVVPSVETLCWWHALAFSTVHH
jgi:hypothetical protein